MPWKIHRVGAAQRIHTTTQNKEVKVLVTTLSLQTYGGKWEKTRKTESSKQVSNTKFVTSPCNVTPFKKGAYLQELKNNLLIPST